MDIRKNRASSPDPRADFVSAVLKLKLKIPSRMGLQGRYDDYVQIHMDSMMLPDGQMRDPGWAHRRPAFGPWHRALLRRFELDLQAAVPGVTLPYWDWTANGAGHEPSRGQPVDGRLHGRDGPGDRRRGHRTVQPGGLEYPRVGDRRRHGPPRSARWARTSSSRATRPCRRCRPPTTSGGRWPRGRMTFHPGTRGTAQASRDRLEG